MIVLVRHAMPLIEEDTPPAAWRLSAAGRRAARRIGHLLPSDSVLVSSPEPKAHETLTCATNRPVTADARLGEVTRPLEPISDNFQEPRLRYVAGDPPPGWEPPEQVIARIDAVIADHAAQSRPLVLAGHGMAFTAWLASHGYVDDPATFWSSLRLPDVLLVEAGVVQRLLGD